MPKTFSVNKICRSQHIIFKIYRNIYCREVAIILFESGHFNDFSHKIGSFSFFMKRFWDDREFFQLQKMKYLHSHHFLPNLTFVDVC